MFLVVIFVNRPLLELDHSADELLDRVAAMDDAIRFVECVDITFYFGADSAWSVLLV